jgi:biotin synthase
LKGQADLAALYSFVFLYISAHGSGIWSVQPTERDFALLCPGPIGITGPVIDEPLWDGAELLAARGPAQEALHARASAAAAAQFGRRVFLRGVVEVSNYCRENCSYCGMRRDNSALKRFRAEHERLAELLVHHRPASITDVNIQMGEDPVAVREVVIPLVRTLRRETPLGVSICLGTLNPDLYQALREAGASIYIIKFEMSDAGLYQEMRAPGSIRERLDSIRWLAQHGWHVSSGFIAGLPGQSDRQLLDNFDLAARLPLAGCSVSPFIPGELTPLADARPADIDVTLNCMAMLRLTRSDWIIPAVSALNLVGAAGGYRRGLRTGANLVTINLTPFEMREDYVLYKRDRFIMTEERILSAIEAEGLVPSTQSLADFYAQKKNGSAERPAPLAAAAN